MSLSIQDRINRPQYGKNHHLETIELGVIGMALALQYMFDLLKSDGNVYFRYSLAKTPHIVINLNNTIYSVAWFHSTKTYTIFYPWKSHDQEKVKFLSPREVLVYFKHKVLA